VITKSGEVRWLRDFSNPVWDAGEERVVALYGAVQDITEYKRAEEKVLHQARVLTQVSDAVIASDENFVLTSWNPAAERIFGWKAEEVIGRKVADVLKTEFLTRTRTEAIQEIKETGEFSAEVIQARKDGSRIQIEAHTVATHDEYGNITGYVSVNRDITARKQAEEYLRRFQLLSEHSRDIILFIDFKDGRILDANAAAVQAYRYSREELLTLTVQDLRARDTQNLTAEQMAQADARGILFKTVHRRKDGTTFPVEVSSQGATIGGARTLISIVRDITERQQAENEIQLKDQLLHLTSQMAKVGGWEFDPETGKGTWTDEVARIHDLDPAQETNVAMGLSFYVGDSRQKIEQAVKEAVELASPYDLELEMVTAKGNRKWVRSVAIPLVQDDKVVKVQGIFQDITERKQIEEALQAAREELEQKVQERTAALSEANSLLQALMDHMPDHIYFKDLQSRFIRNSRSQAKLLGLSDPSEAVGKSDFDFFPHAAKAYAEEQEVMRAGTPLVDYEEWVVWPDGREMWVSTTKVPLRNADGQTIGIFGISHDITERKQAEQAIRQLNGDLEQKANQLQAANKELEAFSYSVSHDLRAPLRAIDGYARILVEDYEQKLDTEGKRICGVISAEARRMGQLIDDLLAFSRLGRKEMFTSKIDMKALADSVFDELVKEQDRTRIDFQVSKLPGTRGDLSLMHQVWVNLLSNAIKFTSKKERALIEVGCKQSKDENIYYVRDNGAGFDMEYANKLFGVFQRLHGESEFEGTGVGLAIVQRIIRRHGGRVWAEGEVEKGATFYFALPRKRDIHES
jgi:PAS domain S-box-containing protein